ncbi:MAG TPA: hypothetical protein VFO16_06140 [Pseudonocardiaceae bacterium]|nr:hypothetical protein [Pseudonocardiaceae bacterium]
MGDDFYQLFRVFEYTAFRLEVRENYNVAREAESFRKFRAGEPVDLSWAESWFSMVREATAEGRRFSRVRVVNLPLSDYSRFGLWASRLNSDAGEDIRYLARDVAQKAGLPDRDYWLFDSRKLARMRFGGDGRFLGGEVIEDVAEILWHNYWRDAARHWALRREDFETGQG